MLQSICHLVTVCSLIMYHLVFVNQYHLGMEHWTDSVFTWTLSCSQQLS